MDLNKPKIKENIDLSELKKICQEYIDFVDNDKEYHEDNDYQYYVFEKAMEAVFGSNVFEFINNRQE